MQLFKDNKITITVAVNENKELTPLKQDTKLKKPVVD